MIAISFIFLALPRYKDDIQYVKQQVIAFKRPQPVYIYFFVIIVFCYIVFNLIRCLTPVVNADSLYVYLCHPALFVKHHSIYNISFGGISASYRPLNALLLNAFGIVVYNDIFAQLITGWLMGFLCMLSVYALSREFLNRKLSLLAGIFFYTIPTLSWLIYSTKIDLTYTVFELSFWIIFIKWFKSKDLKLLFLAAIFLGFAVGTKYHALFSCVFIGIFIIIVLAKNREKWDWILKTLIVFSFIVIAVGSPSYIRSWVLSGDPIYPFFTKGNYSKETIVGEEKIGDKTNYLESQYQMIFGREFPLKSKGMPDKPIGFLPFLFIPFVIFKKSQNRDNLPLMICFALYYLYLSFLSHKTSETFPRHFLPAIALITVLGAHGLDSLKQYVNGIFIYGTSILALVSMILFSNIGYGASSMNAFKRQISYVSGKISKQEFLEETVFNSWWHMNTEMISYVNSLGNGSIVLALDESPGHYIETPMVQKRENLALTNSDELLLVADQYSATHLFFSQEKLMKIHPEYGVRIEAMVEGLIQKNTIELLYKSDNQYLYQMVR